MKIEQNGGLTYSNSSFGKKDKTEIIENQSKQ